MEYKIGLDLSLNDSGICIKWDDKVIFAQLRPEHFKPHKSSNVIALKYAKWDDDNYSVSELFKVKNAQRQMKVITMFVLGHLKDATKISIAVETPPTRINPRATSSHLDLIRANSIVTSGLMQILEGKYDFEIVWNFVSNSTIKKFAGVRGRGNMKDKIVENFLAQSDLPEFFEVIDKMDDIADAYFAINTLK